MCLRGVAMDTVAPLSALVVPLWEVPRTPVPTESRTLVLKKLMHWAPDWSELMLNCGLSRVGLTVEEWQFFRCACSESGVVASAELATFRDMIRLMDRYGDDGHGDKPVDMSRVVYWFQHVAPVTRSRSRSPRRDV